MKIMHILVIAAFGLTGAFVSANISQPGDETQFTYSASDVGCYLMPWRCKHV